jgi:predicted RNA-binding protein with PUA-like domain
VYVDKVADFINTGGSPLRLQCFVAMQLTTQVSRPRVDKVTDFINTVFLRPNNVVHRAALMNYWLVKSEPESYSIDHLAKEKKQTTGWSGVRNYQARNTMRDLMKVGDRVLFYHSNAEPPAIVGVAKVVREAYPDPTALDEDSDYYDPKSSPENPRWFMVDLQFESKFARPLPLEELREVAALAGMELLRKGSRLSVQPVRKAEFDAVLRLAAK